MQLDLQFNSNFILIDISSEPSSNRIKYYSFYSIYMTCIFFSWTHKEGHVLIFSNNLILKYLKKKLDNKF